MRVWERTNRALANFFVSDFDNMTNKRVRIQHGLLAAWVSMITILLLFILKMVLGIASGSISVVADAFHLLSHLANSVILLVSFWVTAKPPTTRTPFGHGRMEHVAPLIMSVFLFVSGIQIGERSMHQALEPHAIHYWYGLPWVLLATIVVKEWVGQFVRFLGNRIDSHAVLANAFHQRIEAIGTLAVIAGLLVTHYYHRSEVDGYIGLGLSAWLLYLGYTHGREAIVPLLGTAPSRDMIRRVREIAKSVEGIEDVHEIIIHDYGSLYLISLHGEIPEKMGPARMHDIAESCEAKLRETFGGEVVCHTDPILDKTPDIEAIEAQFRKVLAKNSKITSYHDFRVVAGSENQIIILADVDVVEEVPESDFEAIAADLEARVKRTITNVAYCSFYVTPKFAY